MPRKSHRLLPVPGPSPLRRRQSVSWAGYALTAFISMALGAGGTLLAVHYQAPKTAARGPLASSAGPLAPDNGGRGGEPPAALIQNLPPAEAALNSGNWYEDHQQYPQAIAAYTQAIEGELDNPNLRTDLGVAYYKSGQPEKALEQYVVAQKQDPTHENSLFNQGSAYATLGNRRRALAAWRQYLERFPSGKHVEDAHNFIATLQASAPKP